MRLVLTFVSIIALATAASLAAPNKGRSGQIEGTVIDQSSGEALLGATIYLTDKFAGAMADQYGYFIIRGLSPGRYGLTVSHVGYESVRLDHITVDSASTSTVTIRLNIKPHDLSGITVSPGRFSIMGTGAATTQSLTRREIETAPQTGEDLFRVAARLPGIAAEDMTSRFMVRGGEYEEVLVTLDGLRLYEPFHLKDIMGGLFSAVDASAVEGIDLLTGGFTSEYGDKTSGVFNIQTHRPPVGQKKIAAGISFMNARFMTEGTFGDERGSWLISGRRGYLDVLLNLAGESDKIKPTYYDVLGKIQYQLGARQVLSAHFLHAGDRMRVIDNDDNDADTILTSYDNSYFWLNLYSQLTDNLSSHSSFSLGKVTHDRYGYEFWAWQQLTHGILKDHGGFDFYGINTGWEYRISDNLLVKAGIEATELSADYDYTMFDHQYLTNDTVVVLERIDTIQSSLNPSGERIGAYLSSRFRLSDPLTVEVGGRYDRHSYTADESYSPRLNFAYQLGDNTALRGGWGHFYQAQRIDELSPGDKITSFGKAEMAEHRTLGLEHDFVTGVKLRLEAYQKEYSDLRPETRNTFDRLAAFPEYENDRNVVYRDGSSSRGIEIFLRREKGSKFTWMVSYAYSQLRDKIDSIRFKDAGDPDGNTVFFGKTMPNIFDQRHTFYVDLSYRPNVKWQFNLALAMHSGWPYTGVELRSGDLDGQTIYWLNSGERLAERFPTYSRMDIRLNRYFHVWGGRMTVYVEVINLLGKENVRGYTYSIGFNQGRPFVDAKPENNFGTLPMIGVSYSLHM